MSKCGEIHYNKEYRGVTERGNKFIYGTTNRFAANSIHLYFKPAIRVTRKVDVSKLETAIHNELSTTMGKIIFPNKEISNNFISDFQFSNPTLRPNVRSKISYELFLSTNERFKTPQDYVGLMQQYADVAEGVILKHISEYGELAN